MDLSETLDAIISLSGEVNRVHLGRKQKAPAGATVKIGPRGGRYYEVPKGGHPGRHIGERARQAWVKRYGENSERFGQPKKEEGLGDKYARAREAGDMDSARRFSDEVASRRAEPKQEPSPGPKQEPKQEQTSNVTQGPWEARADSSGSFSTRMGGSYEFKDGRSRRDGGDWSDATLFLRPGDARAVAQWQAEAKSNKRVHVVNGEVLLTSYSNMQGRQVVDERIPIAAEQPGSGLAPLELFGARGDGRARSFSEARQGTPIV